MVESFFEISTLANYLPGKVVTSSVVYLVRASELWPIIYFAQMKISKKKYISTYTIHTCCDVILFFRFSISLFLQFHFLSKSEFYRKIEKKRTVEFRLEAEFYRKSSIMKAVIYLKGKDYF